MNCNRHAAVPIRERTGRTFIPIFEENDAVFYWQIVNSHNLRLELYVRCQRKNAVSMRISWRDAEILKNFGNHILLTVSTQWAETGGLKTLLRVKDGDIHLNALILRIWDALPPLENV